VHDEAAQQVLKLLAFSDVQGAEQFLLAAQVNGQVVADEVPPGVGQVDAMGLLTGLVSVVAASGGYLLAGAWGTPPGASLLALTAWQLCWGGLLLVPVAWWLDGPLPALTPAQLPWLAYLIVVGTALAYALWFRGIRETSPVQISLLTRLSPAAALTLDLLAGRHLSAAQWAGLTLIAASVLLGAWPHRPARAAYS